MPPNYQNGPVFMHGIQKNAVKQIRERYVNTHGTQALGPVGRGRGWAGQLWHNRVLCQSCLVD